MIKNLFLLLCFVLLLAGCGRQSEQAEYEPPADNQIVEYTPSTINVPPPVVSSPFISEEVIIGEGEDWPLGGTLTMPSGASADSPVPALMIVHGSGPINRDGYLAGSRPYYEMANYLSDRGIAVLRYDKRTYVHGATIVRLPVYRQTVWEETIEDAILAADLLRADPRIDSDRIFVLGHSLGGVLAPSIHAHGGDFAGLILWAGSPRCLLDIMIGQIEAGLFYQGAEAEQLINVMLPLVEENDADALRQVWAELFDTSEMSDDEVIASTILWVEQQQTVIAEAPALIASMVEMSRLIPYMTPEEAQATAVPFSSGVSAYYFQNLNSHLAKNFIDDRTLPFLVMQGGRDFQILADVDFVLYKELLHNHENVTFRLYDNLNHRFIPTTATNFAEHATGMMTAGQVYPQVFRDIVDWIFVQ